MLPERAGGGEIQFVSPGLAIGFGFEVMVDGCAFDVLGQVGRDLHVEVFQAGAGSAEKEIGPAVEGVAGGEGRFESDALILAQYLAAKRQGA